MATPHDAAWKLLFSYPEMVHDLLAEFVPANWVNDLDLSALDRQSESRMGEDLGERLQDRVWRVDLRNSSRFVMVLLEFQSTVDRTMAVRVLDYTTDLYMDLLRASRSRLPAVLPIVLYHGKRPWTAREEVAMLAEPPGKFLAPYQPSQRYFVLDVGGYTGPLPENDNLMGALIRLAHSRREETVVAILKALVRRPSSFERASLLLHAFGKWYEQARKRHGLPKVQWPDPDDLIEEETMPNEIMRQRVDEWTDRQLEKWAAERKEKWRAEGRTEGRAEGRAEGQVAFMRRLAARKFGAETADRLAEIADPERTLEVGDWLLECESGEELLDRVEGLCESSADGEGTPPI